MIQHRLRVKSRDPATLGPEGDKRHGHPRRDTRLAVRLGIAHQHRPRHHAPRPRHRFHIGRRIGLAHGQRVGPHQRIEHRPHAQLPDQRFRQPRGLVGADRRGETPRAQPLNRCHGTGIQPRLAADPLGIGRQQTGILRIHLGLGPVQPQPRKAKPQHRPPAMKGRQRIPRIQHIAMSQITETGIRRRQKIGRGIGQRAVQIEDHRPPSLQHRETLREAGLPCGPHGWG